MLNGTPGSTSTKIQKQRCSLSLLLCNVILMVLAKVLRKERRKRNAKLLLFADDMYLHTQEPNDYTERSLEFMREFDNLVGYKINTQKLIALYT